MYGLLMLSFDYTKVDAGEFNDWYDTEHVPERERTKGILNAQRWLDVNNRRISVATYDLDAVDVLKSPQYMAIAGKNLSPWSKRVISACKQLIRFEGTQFHPGEALASKTPPALLAAGVTVAPDKVAGAKDMYRVHAARMEKVPGVSSVRLFEGIEGSVPFLELYELASPEVTKSDAWLRADAAHGLGPLGTRAGFNALCGRYQRAAVA